MQDSKLTHFFRSLRASELRWFRDFVQSPYFNKHPDPVRLCTYYIQVARRGFPAGALNRQTMFRKLFPDTSFDEKKLAYVASELLQLGERFLAQQHFEQEAIQPLLATAKACVERELTKNYQLVDRRITTYLRKRKRYDADHFYHIYQQADTAEKHFKQLNLRKPAAGQLQECMLALDYYYLHRRFALTAEILDRSQMQTDPQWPLPDPGFLRERVSQLSTDKAPALKVYLALLDMLEANPPKPALFEEYYRLFLQRADHFSAHDQQAMCYYAINFCIRQAISGQRTYATRALEVYEQGLTHRFLLKDDKISPWDFKNICKIGLGLQRYSWVEQFIAAYVDHLPTEQRADAYHFNVADLAYHQQDYDRALTHLNQVEFSDVPYQLGAKTMLLKIYFETRAEEAFLSLAAAFGLYLKRNREISTGLRRAYLNFIKLSLQIHKFGATRTAKIRQEIQDTPELNARSWLLKQIASV